MYLFISLAMCMKDKYIYVFDESPLKIEMNNEDVILKKEDGSLSYVYADGYTKSSSPSYVYEDQAEEYYSAPSYSGYKVPSAENINAYDVGGGITYVESETYAADVNPKYAAESYSTPFYTPTASEAKESLMSGVPIYESVTLQEPAVSFGSSQSAGSVDSPQAFVGGSSEVNPQTSPNPQTGDVSSASPSDPAADSKTNANSENKNEKDSKDKEKDKDKDKEKDKNKDKKNKKKDEEDNGAFGLMNVYLLLWILI
ncbi:hypothetical protein TUBRATIS_11410 [Tubulinosema ratisbonensis]|uniref:Uncharacterized protein n=1 Tax=Tubulinosema ratisbonensis TaxID=291195 RepID=A0A437AMP2_9MICR|nr:hypothetical protein TUBRATIS_11410 [Tubulinosema ratisbonensis]